MREAASLLLAFITAWEGLVDRAHRGEIRREATRLSEAGRPAPKVDPQRFMLETLSGTYAALAARAPDGKLAVDLA